MSFITGELHITVKMLDVADAGKAGPADHSGPVSSALAKVSSALAGKAGPADKSGTVSVTLKVVGAHVIGAKANAGQVGVALPVVHISVVGGTVNGGQFAVGLRNLVVAYAGADVGSPASHIGVTLKRVRASFNGVLRLNNPPFRLSHFSRRPYANGDVLLSFEGKPGVAVSWVISSGGGVITPLNGAHTDPEGRAYALYKPSGFSGNAVIQVTHGT